MNELTIWDDPLTQTDITTLYNDGKYYAADDLGKDLNGWWQFESSFLVDSSGTWGDASLIVGGGSVTTIDTNLSPSTASASITTDEDTAGTIDLSSFASDVDGDDLTYSITTDVTNGTTALSGSTVTYTPNANYNGTDSFTWSVTDGSLSASGTVDITVNAVNDAPTTDDIATTIDENRTASRSTGITLQGSDIDGDDLTYSIVSAPSNGTASISGATLTYEANQDYNGTETITYKANDGTADSNTSTITITITPVNDTPVVTVGGSITNTQSLSFNGQPSVSSLNGYIVGPDNNPGFNNISDLSISLWTKFNEDDTWEGLFTNGYLQNSEIGFTVRREEDDNKIRLSQSENGVFVDLIESSSSVLASDGWTHIVFTRSGNEWKVYINGSYDGTNGVTMNASQLFDNTLSLIHI